MNKFDEELLRLAKNDPDKFVTLVVEVLTQDIKLTKASPNASDEQKINIVDGLIEHLIKMERYESCAKLKKLKESILNG